MRGFLIFTFVFFCFSFSAQAVCVSVEKANLRSGPGTKYKKSWEVYLYMPFKLLKKKGSWLHIRDFEGDKHWIYERLTTTNYKCAVVKVEKANLRTGPSTRKPKVPWGPAKRYYTYKILKTKGKWLQVIDAANSKAWIYKSLVWVQ